MKPIYDDKRLEDERARLDAVQPDVIQEVAEARPCPVPVRPGSHNAQAAYKAGCEDEWIDRMSAKYGGEW
jgi:hypothetical protein